MKTVVTFLFLFHALLVCGQVPEMSVRDSTLLKAIDIFLDSVASEKLQSKRFVIEAMIRKLEVTPRGEPHQSATSEWPHSEFKWSYELALQGDSDPTGSNYRVATCKFHYRGREVYLLFGAEYFVKYTERDVKKLEKDVNRGRVKSTGTGFIGTLLCQINEDKIHVVTFFH